MIQRYLHIGFNRPEQKTVDEKVSSGALVLVLRTASNSMLKTQPLPGCYYRTGRKDNTE